jgi:hypothetical protein
MMGQSKLWNACLCAFAALLVVSGCGDALTVLRGAIRLSPGEQKSLNYCYVVLRPEIANKLNLSGAQRVKMGVYCNRLKHTLTHYETNPGDPLAAATESMNDPAKKIFRTLEVAGRIEATLNEKQREMFSRLSREFKLLPIRPVIQSERFVLRYSLAGDETFQQVELGKGRKMKAVVLRSVQTSEMAGWLETGTDLAAALRADETEVRRVGLKRLREFPLESLDNAERKDLAGIIQAIVEDPETNVIQRGQLTKLFARVADASHRKTLLAWAETANGRQMTGVVAALSRISPDDAVALGIRHDEPFALFISVLEGFVQHGPDAAVNLRRLDRELGGERSFWIKNALKKIGAPAT